jgi:hypothetical protein
MAAALSAAQVTRRHEAYDLLGAPSVVRAGVLAAWWCGREDQRVGFVVA